MPMNRERESGTLGAALTIGRRPAWLGLASRQFAKGTPKRDTQLKAGQIKGSAFLHHKIAYVNRGLGCSVAPACAYFIPNGRGPIFARALQTDPISSVCAHCNTAILHCNTALQYCAARRTTRAPHTHTSLFSVHFGSLGSAPKTKEPKWTENREPKSNYSSRLVVFHLFFPPSPVSKLATKAPDVRPADVRPDWRSGAAEAAPRSGLGALSPSTIDAPASAIQKP